MKYALGIDDFKTIIEESIYIDKTSILEKILDSVSGTAFLFTRPRRFGKTLALSMMDYFLNVNYKKYSYLFNNLQISKRNDLVEKYQNNCFVIHLNFKDINEKSFMEQKASIASSINESIRFVYTDKYLSFIPQEDLLLFNRIRDNNSTEQDLLDIIPTLMRIAKESFKLNVVVIIDEYDSPIIKANEKDFFNESISFFRNFYGRIFKSNLYLKFGIMSGVTQIAKESIFSGLNNLVNYNVFTKDNEFFGFTEEEVETIIYKSKIDVSLELLKNYYGNYHFGINIVFNPWSVLNCLQNQGEINEYWANTSENTLIQNIIELGKREKKFNDILYQLVTSKSITCYISQNVTLRDIYLNPTQIISLLIASGYLTYDEKNIDDTYHIIIPNKEIQKIFSREIVIQNSSLSNSSITTNFINAFKNNNINEMEKCINNYLLNAFSYFELLDEKSYQVMILTLCAITFENHLVKSEQNVGKGRCDIIIYPSKDNNLGIIIETKYAKSLISQNRLEALSQKAIEQIEEKDYIRDLKKAGASPIYLFGFAFSEGKTKIISKQFVD